jgi:hypothetical protein
LTGQMFIREDNIFARLCWSIKTTTMNLILLQIAQ